MTAREREETRWREEKIRQRGIRKINVKGAFKRTALTLPCWCYNCSGVGSHGTLGSRSVFPSLHLDPKCFTSSYTQNCNEFTVKSKDYKALFPCPVVVILVQFDLSSSIFQQLIASIVSLFSLSVQQTPARK